MTPERMARIHAKCFTQPRPWAVHEFTDLLDSDRIFTCETTHGFALGRIAGPEVELLTIAVDPAFRRQGQALVLMRDFELQAKANGASDAFLEVAEDNATAIALYQRFGFVQAGLRRDYYAGPKQTRVSAIVMVKKL